MMKWYEKSGKDGDVVISTRVRLARNLKDYPFPNRLTPTQGAEVEKKIKKAILESNSYIAEDFVFLPINQLTEIEKISLVERHLVSTEFITSNLANGVIINKSQDISIMINEEDHIRVQVLKEGLELDEVFRIADRVDTLISESLDIAFDHKLGYLTQCPTNLGTGLRASVTMHLPALHDSGAIPRITTTLSKLGIVIRGTYGEGSSVVGAMYQISNQITMGLSELEAIENLKAIVIQLIEQERNARKSLVENLLIEDKISRATGILKSAKILSFSEFLELISLLRFGISAEILSGISLQEINSLVYKVQPATIINIESKNTDVLRSEIVRETLKNIQ